MLTQGDGAASPWRWYVNRLRAMSVGEVAYRGRRTIETLGEDALWRAVPAAWRRAWEPDAARLGRTRWTERGTPRLLSGVGAQEALRRAPASAAAAVTAARRASEGRVQFFGYPEVEVGPGVQVSDPVRGGVWPAVHAKRLDYRDAGAGDPKWAWEVNRLQHLPLQCLAALLADDASLAQAALRRALAWAAAARPPYGIAWSNGFEAGLRGISLALTFDALRASPALDAAQGDLLLRCLWQHGRWIERDPSRGSSANNHLLGEALGLTAIGLLAPELRESAAWARRGLQLLTVEAERQILADGAGAEQAFGYHLFVCDLLLLAVALVRACRGEDAPESILGALARSGDAIAAQVQPGEPEPAYGDWDDGRAFLLDGEPRRSAPAVAASIAAAVGHRACADLAGALDVPALVLFGEDGARRFDGAHGAPARTSAVLDHAGIVILRRDGVRVLFDAGPLGYLQIAAHGHADALSLAVSDGAQELVSDPGTGTYFGDQTRRHALRGTPAHATASVACRDQAEYGGPFLWLRHPLTRLLQADVERGFAVAEVRTRRQSANWRHRRLVAVLPGGEVLVYDRIDGSPLHDRTVSWPLHPALAAHGRGPRLVEARHDGLARLLVAVAAPPDEADVEVTLAEGEWSRRLERVERTAVVRVDLAARAVSELATALVPLRPGDAPDVQLLVESQGGERTIVFRRDREVRVRCALATEPVGVRIDS